MAYEFVFTSLAVPSMSYSSYLDDFVRWKVGDRTPAILWSVATLLY